MRCNALLELQAAWGTIPLLALPPHNVFTPQNPEPPPEDLQSEAVILAIVAEARQVAAAGGRGGGGGGGGAGRATAHAPLQQQHGQGQGQQQGAPQLHEAYDDVMDEALMAGTSL
jgi:hypothetical protein